MGEVIKDSVFKYVSTQGLMTIDVDQERMIDLVIRHIVVSLIE
jgi:hypothetical protein